MSSSPPVARVEAAPPLDRPANILLVGPYDPHCGEYTFLAPPLGVWRLCGYLNDHGHMAEVFDPNNCDGDPASAFRRRLLSRTWDIVGSSTTGMTLRASCGQMRS